MDSPPPPNRVHELFDAATELPPDQRTAYLASACGDDAKLRAEVEGLLSAHDTAGAFLSDPAVPPSKLGSEDILPLGTTIGPYTLVRVIGEGGYGTVYLAQQAPPLRRRVALKVIKPGMDTREVIAR